MHPFAIIEEFLHGPAEIPSVFPVKIQIPLAEAAVQLIVHHAGVEGDLFNQSIADEGYAHSGTGDVVGCKLLVQFKPDVRGNVMAGRIFTARFLVSLSGLSMI